MNNDKIKHNNLLDIISDVSLDIKIILNNIY